VSQKEAVPPKKVHQKAQTKKLKNQSLDQDPEVNLVKKLLKNHRLQLKVLLNNLQLNPQRYFFYNNLCINLIKYIEIKKSFIKKI